MKKLNLADFKLKVAKDAKSNDALLSRLAGATLACCHEPDGPSEYPPMHMIG